MKPIFKEEKEFLETKLGIDLPDGCWRSTTKIYLNHFDEKPFLTFKVIPLENKLVINQQNLNIACQEGIIPIDYVIPFNEITESRVINIK